MTFDEARKELERDGIFKDNGADLFVDNIIEQLRQEYAPTIEMTKEQVDVIDDFKNNFSASYLPEVIHNQPEGDWSFLDELSGKLFGHRQGGMTDKNIEDIMQAWLHPETIKIIGENDE